MLFSLPKSTFSCPDFYRVDHVHLVVVIPPRYAVSAIVGKIKANTSREIRQSFPWVKKVYWRNEFWSVGFFSSTGKEERADAECRDAERQQHQAQSLGPHDQKLGA